MSTATPAFVHVRCPSNSFRDLGPRIVHSLLPLLDKGGSDWSYAWIPVVGPPAGAPLAGGLYQLAFT